MAIERKVYQELYSHAMGTSIKRIGDRYLGDKPKLRAPLYYHTALTRGWYSDSVSGDKRTPVLDFSANNVAFYMCDPNTYALARDLAYTRAYDDLVSQLKDYEGGASMAITFAESRSSFEMIENRLTRLVRSQDALRAGLIPEAAAQLMLDQRNAGELRRRWPSRKAVARDFASSYLEIIFGWLPLVKDIQDAINVLQNPPAAGTFTGKGVWRDEFKYSQSPGWLPSNGWITSGARFKISRRFTADVDVQNPNLLLANRLGFVNLPAVAFELIPGSFLLNWFVPVQRFLERYTDFVGRRMTRSYISTKIHCTSYVDSNYAGYGGRGVELTEHVGTAFYRENLNGGVPLPETQKWFRLPVRGLRERSVTLSALFVQNFSKRKT